MEFSSWILNGDTGKSSKTIWSVINDVEYNWHDAPYDYSDFNRCYELVKLIDNHKELLDKVVEKYPYWKPYVDNWDSLVGMGECETDCNDITDYMSELRVDSDLIRDNIGKNVLCGCGYVGYAPHPVGEGDCCRYHITNPDEIPKNRRLITSDFMKAQKKVFIWDIGQSSVLEYTLFNQRMYARDKYGNWTRPKNKKSTNSLTGNW